jgi:hypothetical protein
MFSCFPIPGYQASGIFMFLGLMTGDYSHRTMHSQSRRFTE